MRFAGMESGLSFYATITIQSMVMDAQVNARSSRGGTVREVRPNRGTIVSIEDHKKREL